MSLGAPEVQTADEFRLPGEMREAIVAHALREAPRECCGIVAGRDGAPVQVYETRNIAEGNRLYEIDPRQLIDLEFRLLPEQGSEIVAIYHSHPESPAYPSLTDVELAFWPDAIYLICSLADGQRPDLRGFRIRDSLVHEVTLTQ
ncbi:MAG: M67 family metallopeptidase [Chloroflexi bacterium]|nr:M67 family metallopeptidase [Chloroflexota bacterium]